MGRSQKKAIAVSEGKEDPKQKKQQLEKEVDQLEKQKAAFEQALAFAKQVRSQIWDTNDQGTKENVTYRKFSKEDILSYMESPTSNEKNLRNASMYMWDASTQYKRLIEYYAMLPKWDYILSPMNFDLTKVKRETFHKQYKKVQDQVELMNLKHELHKASKIVLRDGVLFGAIWSNKTSFYIQRINPDYCSLTSIIDGTFSYSVDMSRIAEKKLSLYPPEFTTMYNTYKSTGVKWQEVPEDISFCLKADETMVAYSIPPWASTLPMLYDIETYKALQETSTKLANYKILGMQIELNDDGTPKVDWDLANQYYRQLCSVLPPYVGAFVSPMKTTGYEFERSGTTNDVDTVGRAEEQYWFNTGTSALLHGSVNSNTAGALKLSIRSDEEIMFSIMDQAERLINRILKSMSGNIKFAIHFLRTTVYNQEEQVALFKEAATLGVPGAKSAYAASLGIPQSALPGFAYLEDEVLGDELWKPLTSGYTGGGVTDSDDKGGRPPKKDEDLDDEGVATRENDENANR